MSVFSKVFGKKRTVDTTHPNHAQAQQPQAALQQGPNEQANAFDGFEILDHATPDGAPVADVYLNVDTESKSAYAARLEAFHGTPLQNFCVLVCLRGFAAHTPRA